VAVEKKEFRHESLQDRVSIARYLEALAEGLRTGRLVLRSDAKELVLEPRGLLGLEISAKRNEGRTRLLVKVGWSDGVRDDAAGPLVIGGGETDE
jgi:amphi-Trp domain-containing protein